MGQFDGRRISFVRLGGSLAAIAALVFTSLSGWRWFEDSQSAAQGKMRFAAYVDVTTTPQLDFGDPSSRAARDVVLSFIVASPSKPCEPSWGTYYSLNQAGTDLDLDRRVARLRQNDGDVVVSFGGAINDELAVACKDEDRLLDAYSTVVDRYDLRTIDLDLEGAGLADAAAAERRAAVIAKLQMAQEEKDKDLRVWLTLPVSPAGLSEEGVQAVASMLAAGVDVSGVNVMTMDYGESRAESQSMADASIAALNATHGQLSTLYAEAGSALGPASLWRLMGATPMIGQNDVPGEVFGLDAAAELNQFARDKGMGRLSMWSLNRDRTCGENYPDTQVVSTSCSGVDQGGISYAKTLSEGLSESPGATPVTPTESETVAARPTQDDPEKSPYPIWEEDVPYVQGDRIVWHHNVYLAKWWTTGDLPDDPTIDGYSSPWELLGPVLPGEKPVSVPKLPQGTYPEWKAAKTYTDGNRVMLDGMAFTAKWWTQGDSPTARYTQAAPSPWEQLTETEVRRVLADADK